MNHTGKTTQSKLWTHKMDNKVVYLDKVGLEAAIEFQDIGSGIGDGYYYDEGLNTKLKESSKHLFDKRLEAKKDNNDSLYLIC